MHNVAERTVFGKKFFPTKHTGLKEIHRVKDTPTNADETQTQTQKYAFTKLKRSRKRTFETKMECPVSPKGLN